MVRRVGASLEDLHGRRGFTNNQEGGNLQQKGICGVGTEQR